MTGMRMVVGHKVEDAFDQGEGTVKSLNPSAPLERRKIKREKVRWSAVVWQDYCPFRQVPVGPDKDRYMRFLP